MSKETELEESIAFLDAEIRLVESQIMSYRHKFNALGNPRRESLERSMPEWLKGLLHRMIKLRAKLAQYAQDDREARRDYFGKP